MTFEQVKIGDAITVEGLKYPDGTYIRFECIENDNGDPVFKVKKEKKKK